MRRPPDRRPRAPPQRLDASSRRRAYWPAISLSQAIREDDHAPPAGAPEPAERGIGAVRSVRVTLGAGLLLIAAVGALTLTRAPPRVLRASVSGPKAYLGGFVGDGTICQAHETLPAGASAIRVWLGVEYGSRIRVRAFRGAQVLSEGSRGPDWTSRSVTVPVTPLPHAAADVRLCLDLGPSSEPIFALGVERAAKDVAVADFAPAHAAQPLRGRVGVEYLASGHGSWWTRIPSVARHMGIGHALTGTWVALLIAALVAAAALLAVRLTLRESRSLRPTLRRLGHAVVSCRLPRLRIARAAPRAAWICALIAFLNACAWSLIVPPFQGRDEEGHFAYVQRLAESGSLPESGHENGTYSPAEMLVLEGLHFWEIVRWPQTPAISSLAEQRTLSADVHARASRQGSGEAGSATGEPPLYYALQTIPYALGDGNILTQLQLMRLVGALFGAATALLSFLFLRELLPRAPWAVTIGALCIALAPLLAFMSGSVNPDSMLYAVAAAILLCLARAFRGGLTRRGAAVLGILIGVGFMTKLNFVGFAIGVYAGLLVLALRRGRRGGRRAPGPAAIAACIGISPVALFALRNLALQRPILGPIAGLEGLLVPGRLFSELSYIWQAYLPRLPGMTHYFTGLATYKDVWFDRSVGLYGWLDTTFPGWVDNVALVPAAAVVLLCARELLARRHALRARLPELGVYSAIAVGVLVMIAAASFLGDALSHVHAFGEPRYLLPLLPLLGAVLALAVRGAGRRWSAVAGAALVILFLGHDLFSQLQVIARYYG